MLGVASRFRDTPRLAENSFLRDGNLEEVN